MSDQRKRSLVNLKRAGNHKLINFWCSCLFEVYIHSFPKKIQKPYSELNFLIHWCSKLNTHILKPKSVQMADQSFGMIPMRSFKIHSYSWLYADFRGKSLPVKCMLYFSIFHTLIFHESRPKKFFFFFKVVTFSSKNLICARLFDNGDVPFIMSSDCSSGTNLK